VNFFQAQDEARRASRRLVFSYSVATLLIVASVTLIVSFVMFLLSDSTYHATFGRFLTASPGIPASVALVTALFILGASAAKTIELSSSGGGRVARQMGGTLVSADVNDPLRRRLRNVVEEMAIASGVPVPEIYVLEQESGINAFAAGSTTSDAAIAVTRGALELLSRDELQGVIGHEFSHILNGDMRLNIRLMGILFGIMGLAMIGRLILRGFRHVDDARGAMVVAILGFGLTILGAIGLFSGRVIKAGVSRQREFLADASAVQFTRQTDGIANALKKIGGYGLGSTIKSADPEQVSHMLFGSGARLSGLFATHPPLVERIQAIDPSFRPGDFPRVDPRLTQLASAEQSEAVSGFAASPAAAPAKPGTPGDLPESIAATVGQPGKEHVQYAQQLRQSIPESLYSAAHSVDFAYLLTIALVLDRSGKIVERQLAIARDQLGRERADLLRRFYDELATIGTEYRLPLLEIAFPALKQRPPQELGYLLSMTARMIETDGEIDLYEFCFYRILSTNLARAADSRQRSSRRRPGRAQIQSAAIALLRILADYGHGNDAASRAAFRAGTDTLGDWAQDFDYRAEDRYTISVLDDSLDVLQGLNSKGKESLLRAIMATATHDTRLAVAEAELIRAVCATLDFPLPPILANR
jgi:Zn-dependent protease with chaperone function